MPDFKYEQEFWEKEKIVAGADEVGRGAFAGPVVAAAVILPQNITPEVVINDSKKLTIAQRECANVWIRNNAVGYGIGSGSVKMINSAGIMSAVHFAYRSAIYNLQISMNSRVQFLLVDAFYIPRIRGIPKSNQTPIIRGDSASISIAAASIIAKVYRDDLMISLGSIIKNKPYKWHKNKGYGTKEHREVIAQIGSTIHHRTQYLKTSFLL